MSAYFILFELERDIVAEFVDACQGIVEGADAFFAQSKSDDRHGGFKNYRLDSFFLLLHMLFIVLFAEVVIFVQCRLNNVATGNRVVLVFQYCLAPPPGMNELEIQFKSAAVPVTRRDS